MEPDFDDLYEDDLDAMEDFPYDYSPKSKVSYTKVSPIKKIISLDDNLNTCSFEMDDQLSDVNGIMSKDVQSTSETAKRLASDDNSVDIPVGKRLKTLEEELGFSLNDLEEFEDVDQPNVIKAVSNRVYSRAPYGVFTRLLDCNGSRCYLKMKSAAQHKIDIECCNENSSLNENNLKYTIPEMRNELNEKLVARLMSIADKSEASSSSHVLSDDHIPEEEKEEDTPIMSSTLWVDKYSPDSYVHLLSDEAINRLVLKWIKLWNVVVFNSAVAKDTKTKNLFHPQNDSSYRPSTFKPFVPKPSPWTINTELDKNSCPVQKVVLLNGPPGLGKTTLAHIVAKHAGYKSIEINASDDRSLAIFKQRIDSATQMTSALDAQGRPNCLIIDEIDGAPTATVNYLLTVLNATGIEVVGTKRKGRSILQRPIICICNDLYVPSLRLLRQKALIVNVPPTYADKLANRLIHIAHSEGMKCDLSTMTSFADKADCDIRACLNTLQFMKSKGKQLTMTYLQNLSIGGQNHNKGLLTTWKSVFTIPKKIKLKVANPHDIKHNNGIVIPPISKNENKKLTRFDEIYELTTKGSDSDRIMVGCFENYLSIATKDRYMIRICMCTDWLMDCDLLSKTVQRTQNYSLLSMTNYAPVVFNLNFALTHTPKIIFPKQITECKQKANKQSQNLDEILHDIDISVRGSINVTSINLTLLPYLDLILKPSLRPVNIRLFSEQEKEQLSQVVKTMVCLNMNYTQKKDQRGLVDFILEPDIDELSKFDCFIKNAPPFRLSYPSKQLIASEIEIEKIRKQNIKMIGPMVDEDEKIPDKTNNIYKNFSKVADNITPQIRDRKVKDFFGRDVIVTVEERQQEVDDIPLHETDIWYKYKEGYTNAVRKPVRISELI